MSISILKAERDLLPGLKEVWRVCFGDDAGYVDFFYACNFDRIETYAALDGTRAVGMLHLIPAWIDDRPAYYGYAMGMLPEYRGTGIFPAMHKAVFSLVRERGAAYFLKPANPRLGAYYAAQGLAEGFYLKKKLYAADKSKLRKADMALADLGADEYGSLRNACFDRKGFVKWDAAALSYAVAENLRSGGFVRKLTVPEGEFALFGAFCDETVAIRETTLPGDALDKYGGALAAYFGCERLAAELPVYSAAAGGEIVPAGMIYNMGREEEGYFNLPLD